MDRLVQKDIFLIGIKMNWKDVWKEVVLKILKFNSMVELELAGLSVVPKNKKERPYTSISITAWRTMKGNVDAELVLHAAAIEYDNYNQAVIVTSDGDFACLIRYLDDNNKLKKIITPTEKFSKLLKPFVKSILPLKTIKNQVNKK